MLLNYKEMLAKAQHKFAQNPDLLIVTGSRMYGSHNENSDWDLRGMVNVPYPCLLGRDRFDQYETTPQENGIDYTCWALPKYFHLLEIFSPNVFEQLFAPKENILISSKIAEELLSHKHLFVCKRMIAPIIGFATGQWKSVHGDGTRKLGSKRKELVASYGFNTKGAYHAIRLLGQGIEILTEGTITFPRPDSKRLKEIKEGQYPFNDCQSIYDESLSKLQELEATSKIPEIFDKKKIDDLYYDLILPTLQFFIKRK